MSNQGGLRDGFRAPESQAGGGAPAPRRIVVADDNRDSADSLGMMLSIMGYDVRTAYDGEGAVALAESFQPEIMVLDVGMPRMSGYEVARRVRGLASGEDVLLVALTGWSDDEDRRRATEAGFDRYWVKPVRPADLDGLAGVGRRA